MQGYSKPYRFDRNRNGVVVFIYVREDIPSRELNIHNTSEHIGSILSKLILLKLGGFIVTAITHLASLTNSSLKILKNR